MILSIFADVGKLLLQRALIVKKLFLNLCDHRG